MSGDPDHHDHHRGNIGNSKILNKETGDDLLQQTHMNATKYAVAVSLFSLAYALFEVPSNYIMKRYVRPSLWLGTLLFCWGAFTVGFSGVKTYSEVVVLRFFIGMSPGAGDRGGPRRPR